MKGSRAIDELERGEMDGDNAEIVLAAELESVEDRLRCAVEDLEAAAGSLVWVEQDNGADWSGSLPTSVEIRDFAQQLRSRLHNLIVLGLSSTDD